MLCVGYSDDKIYGNVMGVGGNCFYFLEVETEANSHKRDRPHCAEEAIVIAAATTKAMAFGIEGDSGDKSDVDERDS